MTAIFNKCSTVGAILVLITGCSSNGELPAAGQWNDQQNKNQPDVRQVTALDACLPEAGTPFHFRKSILVTGTIGVPALARDLPGLANLTSERLQTHLNALERFNVLATHGSTFDSMGSGTAAHVRYLGKEHASQFVVKLEIEDLTIHSRGWKFPKLFVGKNQRNIAMKLYIFGTEYGELFHSQQYQRAVGGDVIGYPGNGNAVTTPWFNTDLGSKIDEMLKTMSSDINEKLACVPFSTQVTAIEGKNIYINAGYLQGIRPGETLRVYPNRYKLTPDGTKIQGKNEGWIKVESVFPSHSIASTTQDMMSTHRMDIGDTVRAW